MSPDAIIFDLDGTLWDTTEACAHAWNAVVASEGLTFRPICADDVRAVTGKTHEECIRLTFAGLPDQQLARISELTQTEDTRVIAEMGGRLYSGVQEGLQQLRQHYRLFIVSNCQSGYIELFLTLNGLSELFEDYECWGNTGKAKPHNLRDVIDRNGLERPIMVGDTEGDAVAARHCCIPFAMVEYGFGEAAVADHRFGAFDELTQALIAMAVQD